MRNIRWTLAFAMVAMSAACGGGGSSDNATPPTTTAPNETVVKANVYDISAALLALFNAQFPEAKATAKIEGLIFDLKVSPLGGGPASPPAPGSTIPAVTYFSSFIGLQLTASGYWESDVIGVRYERFPLHLVGAVMSTPRNTSVCADASQTPPIVPTAAAIGDSQELLRGPLYELDTPLATTSLRRK